MIRVLHIVHSMNRGGLETTLMNIFRNINRELIQFDFLVSIKDKGAYDDEIKSLGGNIYYVPPRSEGILQNRKQLKTFFENHNYYKIIHQHVSSLSYVKPLKYAMKNSIPVRIVHSRNTMEGGSFIHKYLHLWNQKKIKSYATDFFACSDLAAKWLYGKKQYNKGEYKIINNGIMTEKFIFNIKVRESIRKEFGIENKFVIGHVGRFHPQKNHLYLIDIFKNFFETTPNSVLLLIGDGALRNQIEEHIKKLNLTENVILTGVKENISELLQCMDIFVMPSFYEGLPGTIVEAQGAGLPCLISDKITRQVKITDLVHYESIDSDPSIWSNRIFQIINNFERRNTQSDLINAGFDMRYIAKELESFYLEKSINF